MAYRVVDDMPMPSARGFNGSKGGGDKYGLRDLKVGQAIIIDASDDGFIRDKRGYVATHPIAAAAYQLARRHGGKFATRRLPDGSFGIWRTA